KCVKVSIYYEALCADSTRFIARQLYPNYSKLKNYMQLELIPYGKATHNFFDKKWHFECQHGRDECKGNKYQSCALAQNNGEEKDISFVHCVMRERNPSDVRKMENCAKRLNINWDKISTCARTNQGDNLLARNGNKTNNLEPNISFVPTVVYNDQFDEHLQDLSLTDFSSSLNVSLYYEVLCPDSIRFVTEQLYPGYQKIGDYLNLEYIPFGFAEATNDGEKWNFTCQHGPEECYGNKVQSCAIELNSGNAVTEFVNCALADDASSDVFLEWCANYVGISWSDIKTCVDSGLGDELLVKNGDRTEAVTPAISYIPTIIFNGVYDDTLQYQGEHYFLSTACQLLSPKPDNCASV
ncbi:gamma-interferon-inducible lysosomal thiol reductase-like, partial [Asbolus verrucosus]